MSSTARGGPIEIIAAVEPFMPSYRPSVMAAKLLSLRVGAPLRIVSSDWLASKGFDPYMPSFFAALDDGGIVLMRSEENLNHRELARLLEGDLRRLIGQRSKTTAATATP